MDRSENDPDRWRSLSGALAPVAPQAAETAALRTCEFVARAIDEGRIRLAYQPVVDARCLSQVAFHESLLRLEDAGGALLPASQFLPAVAGTDLEAPLDCIALELALETLWSQPEARISVNIAPGTMESSDWHDLLSGVLDARPDVGYRLIVEITERIDYLGHPACHGFVRDLHARGVTVALDDFGAGTTGFRHFRDLRLDVVKIDGSFGDGLARNPDAQVLVRALVDIARHFEMLTVIEFIDSPEDASMAMKLGVDCLQGFLFGHPAPALKPRGGDTDTSRDAI